jgi:hypothetical protein
MANELTNPRDARSTSGLKKGLTMAAISAAAALGTLVISPTEAAAQAEPSSVSPTAKGIIGGFLLGAEVVVIPMGAAGLKPWWPYLVFGGVGAAGGAVGGWAVETYVEEAEPALYMLAGGLALVIPALVLSLNATTRDDFEDDDPNTIITAPQENPEVQPADPNAPPTTPGTPQPSGDGTTTIKVESNGKKHIRRPRHARVGAPTALFDFGAEDVRIGVPAVRVQNMYTVQEISMYGVEQKTEVVVPLFGAAF